MPLYRDTIHGRVQLTPQEEQDVLNEREDHNSADSLKKRLKRAVSRERKARERNGVVFKGVRLSTDAKDMDALTRLYAFTKNTGKEVNFKGPDNTYRKNTAIDMESKFNAAVEYIQSLFDIEKEYYDEIDSLHDVGALMNYDIKNKWPS